ncbi:MAG TPA: rhomboid family intramembrane serine protease [Solirubrobacteraceae bacterium]|jgi:membrane associated rhomboid family serine protease|nr:rhomboid family intramembrane serine protease [Solirubrobacteraceae bacterium]
MTSSADLFVVCKKCGSEVSPYITECPYCGHRLRRRAPKLPRDRLGKPRTGLFRRRSLGRIRSGEIAGLRSDTLPYVTIALVLASCAMWIAAQGAYLNLGKLIIAGPLNGDWWRLLTSPFVYGRGFSSGLFMFATLLAIAVFGGLLERRHGPFVVLALFFVASVTGGLAAEAVYVFPVVSGANAGALALLAAWAAPSVMSARAGEYYEGDLLGTGAIAVVLLAMPYARPEVSWLAGVIGAAFGLTLGLGLGRVRSV